jgi:ribose transport system substrate-binding protein
LATYPGIKILNDNQDAKGSRDGWFAVAQTILTRFGHINGMFIINVEQAIGPDLGARKAHRSEMVITTVDGSPDGRAQLKSPESRIFATAAKTHTRSRVSPSNLAWNQSMAMYPRTAPSCFSPC